MGIKPSHLGMCPDRVDLLVGDCFVPGMILSSWSHTIQAQPCFLCEETGPNSYAPKLTFPPESHSDSPGCTSVSTHRLVSKQNQIQTSIDLEEQDLWHFQSHSLPP